MTLSLDMPCYIASCRLLRLKSFIPIDTNENMGFVVTKIPFDMTMRWHPMNMQTHILISVDENMGFVVTKIPFDMTMRWHPMNMRHNILIDVDENMAVELSSTTNYI